MSGGIDPLLHGDEDDGARVSAAVDVTALYELHRVRLVRLAAAITLDGVVAEEVVNEAFVVLQKRIGSVEDPIAHLHRTVARASASHGITGGRGFTAQRRRKIAAHRPVPVEPMFADPVLAAMWQAITMLHRRQRAVMVLSARPSPTGGATDTVDLADIAEELGWARRTVAATRHAALVRLAGAVGAQVEPIEACVARTLAAAMPQLAEGEDVALGDGHLDPTPTGRNALRLFIPAEPKRHRIAWTAVVVVLVAAMVGTVAFFSHRQGDLVPITDGTTPAQGGVIVPRWYGLLRPLVPDRFDRLALVALDADRIGFVAIETSTGRSLDIDISRRATTVTDTGSSSATTPRTTATVSVTTTPSPTSSSIPDGVRFVRQDGTAIEVRCEQCQLATDVQAIAARIAEGFTLDDVGSSFGTPSGLRTDLSALAAAVATAVPDATDGAIAIEVATAATAPVAVASDGAVQVLDLTHVGVSVFVVHGVFPAPTTVLRPGMRADAMSTTGWVVQPDGTATRLVLTGSSVSPDAAPGLLDALGAVAAIDRTAGTP